MTPSGLCRSFSRRLLKHRLPEHDVYNALVAYRRKHGDSEKSRKWYEREVKKYQEELTKDTGAVHPLPRALRRNANADAMEDAARHGEQLPHGKTIERLLLIQLARFSPDGRRSWPSQKRLADVAGIGVTHVSKRLSGLISSGCVTLIESAAPGRNNTYGLNTKEDHREHKA